MGCIYKKVKYYKRVTLIVDADKAQSILDKYHNKGYLTRSFGPKITSFPKCDPNRTKMVLEKEIAKPEQKEGG